MPKRTYFQSYYSEAEARERRRAARRRATLAAQRRAENSAYVVYRDWNYQMRHPAGQHRNQSVYPGRPRQQYGPIDYNFLNRMEEDLSL